MAKGKASPGGSAPKGGMQPKQKTAVKPATKIGKIAKGAPTRKSGADTDPWSSARSGKR